MLVLSRVAAATGNGPVSFASRFLHKSLRDKVDYSKFPAISASDVTETVSRGSGPGGQSVAKTSNAVRLKHEPTGVSVKVHESRSLEKNRSLAMKRLAEAVDAHVNGADSVREQMRRLELEREEKCREQARKKREKKALLAMQQSEEQVDTVTAAEDIKKDGEEK